MKLTIKGWSKIVGTNVSDDWVCNDVIENAESYDFKICNGDRSLVQTLSLWRNVSGQNKNVWVLTNESTVGSRFARLELDEIRDIRKFIEYGLYEALLKNK